MYDIIVSVVTQLLRHIKKMTFCRKKNRF